MDLKDTDVIILDFNSHSIATVGTIMARPIFPVLNELFKTLYQVQQSNIKSQSLFQYLFIISVKARFFKARFSLSAPDVAKQRSGLSTHLRMTLPA